jgi:hypothetical protein
MADETIDPKEGGSLKIEFYAPDETPTIFSDAQFVIHTGNEFVISFYQAQYPAISEELKLHTDTIKSRCLVRVVLTPFQMQRLAGALQANLNKAVLKEEKQAEE